MPRGQLNVRNAAVPVFGDCRGRPMVASIYGFDLGRDEPFNSSSLASPEESGHFCSRGLWTTDRAGPDADSRTFAGELDAVAVQRLDVPACGLLSRVMGVASRSHTAFPPADVSLELEAAFARIFSVSTTIRSRSLGRSFFVGLCQGCW